MKFYHAVIASSLIALTGVLAPAPSLHADQLRVDDSQLTKPATIRILLDKSAEGALIEVKGRHNIYNPIDNCHITSGSSAKRTFLYPHSKGLHWGEDFSGFYQLRIVPSDPQTSVLVNGIEYRGCIEVYNMNGILAVVNEVSLENFLKSTLNCQFPKEANPEVLDAICITARTNAMYFVSKKGDSPWHADAKEIGYEGHSVTLTNPHIDRSIERTRYAVLTFNEKPFAATWTEDSAGATAKYSSIFRKSANTPPGVTSAVALKSREKHQWKYSISKSDLARVLNVSNIKEIDLFVDSESTKVYAIRFKGADFNENVDFLSLQQALGKDNLKSNDFKVKIDKDQVVFAGFGKGHGVGLCLYSAHQMAKHGKNTAEILKHFFPETSIKTFRSFRDLQATALDSAR